MDKINKIDVIENAMKLVNDLTKKQQQVLNFLYQFHTINKRTPSYNEIADGLNMKGKQNVYQIMNYLEEKGYISRHDSGIQIIKGFTNDSEWLAKKIREIKNLLIEGIISEDEYKKYEDEIIKKYRTM